MLRAGSKSQVTQAPSESSERRDAAPNAEQPRGGRPEQSTDPKGWHICTMAGGGDARELEVVERKNAALRRVREWMGGERSKLRRYGPAEGVGGEQPGSSERANRA